VPWRFSGAEGREHTGGVESGADGVWGAGAGALGGWVGQAALACVHGCRGARVGFVGGLESLKLEQVRAVVRGH